jgi:hypothetical protein
MMDAGVAGALALAIRNWSPVGLVVLNPEPTQRAAA